jgi:subtilisin family serine protease
MRNTDGALLVNIRASNTDNVTLQALRDAGADILHIAPAYSNVSAYVQPERLQELAGLAQVEHIHEQLRPYVGSNDRRAAVARQGAQATGCPSGPVISQGDVLLKARQARTTYNLDGAGVTVGVLSDSFNQEQAIRSAEQAIAAGELPGQGNPCGYTTPVKVVAEGISGDTDEGRAMLEIVHDLAPGANLAFATALGTPDVFANNIRQLQSLGVDILVDDVVYLGGEPFFQDGPIAVAIQEATAQGAIYFTAAGNENATDGAGNTISSYEATYRPTPCPPAIGAVRSYQDCHTFNPNGSDPTSHFDLRPASAPDAPYQVNMDFQWAEPWYGVTTDLDIYLIGANGEILIQTDSVNTGAQCLQQPSEYFFYKNPNTINQRVSLVIARRQGTGTPRIKYILHQANGIIATEYNKRTNSVDIFGPTIGDHAMSNFAISVAAVNSANPTAPEPFSSRGPARVYYGPVLGTEPAKPLPAPEIRAKPDIAAVDNISTSFFCSGSTCAPPYTFFGTSAAAPHGAAVAALLKQAANNTQRSLNYAQAKALLQASADPIPNGSLESTGKGLLNAERAIRALFLTRSYLPLLSS